MTTLNGPRGLVAEVEPYGPSDAEVDAFLVQIARREPLRGMVQRGQYRWLRFKPDDQRDGKGAFGIPDRPTGFRATLYDYANERAIEVSGDIDRPDAVTATPSDRQPLPSLAEFEAAVELLRSDPRVGPALRSGTVRAYRPMPPFVTVPGRDGLQRRAIVVGLHAPGARTSAVELGGLPGPLDGAVHRFVAMVVATGEVYWDGAVEQPPFGADCAAPPEDDECAEAGQTGQAAIATRDADGREVWRLLCVRPAASSGLVGSGLELRHVSYRGVSVLERAHMPLLNVLYLASTVCGPSYRDWLDEEACFEATGRDVGAGFRVCEQPPRTILDKNNDGGSFRGVAVFFDGTELVLLTETRAGWYRYAMEWRLHADGSIRPRMGFSAIQNPCTCQSHVHHAYWRFDFAIGRRDGHRVEEFNDPPLELQPSNLHMLEYEASRTRDASRNRHWQVRNLASGFGYRVLPGPNDGTADVYGAGDTWWLRYHQDEIDDGQGFTRDPVQSRARMDVWADGEPIDGENVVLWYGGHFLHTSEERGQWLGPELVPFRTEPAGSVEAGASGAAATAQAPPRQPPSRLARQVPEVP